MNSPTLPITPRDDERYMALALEQARLAAEAGEIPVGAVVVDGGRVVGRGHNLTERLADVTAHAEIQAITAAAATLGGKYMPRATIYVTVEPCLMCAGAIAWAQIRRVVIGTADPKRGYTAYTSRAPFHARASVTTGVLEQECAQLMRDFFAARRPARTKNRD